MGRYRKLTVLLVGIASTLLARITEFSLSEEVQNQITEALMLILTMTGVYQTSDDE